MYRHENRQIIEGGDPPTIHHAIKLSEEHHPRVLVSPIGMVTVQPAGHRHAHLTGHITFPDVDAALAWCETVTELVRRKATGAKADRLAARAASSTGPEAA